MLRHLLLCGRVFVKLNMRKIEKSTGDNHKMMILFCSDFCDISSSLIPVFLLLSGRDHNYNTYNKRSRHHTTP